MTRPRPLAWLRRRWPAWLRPRPVLEALLDAIGVTLLVYAAWTIYAPLGCAVAGAAALALSWLIGGTRRPRRKG